MSPLPPSPGLAFPAGQLSLPSQIPRLPPPHPTRPRTPYTCSALFLSQDQVENANDEAKAEADPGQDEAIAVVALWVYSSITTRIMMSVDGRPDHNAKPCNGKKESLGILFVWGEKGELFWFLAFFLPFFLLH